MEHLDNKEFRTLADNIPNLAWMAAADGAIYWYNKRWYDYTGTTPDQMKGLGWQTVHDPARLPEVLHKWKEAIAHQQTFEMVFPLKGADGSYRQFLTRVIPVRNEEKILTHWFGSNTDVTEKINAENALRGSEQRFAAAVAAVKGIIWTNSPEGRMTGEQVGWGELTGQAYNEYQGYGWADAVHPDDAQPTINAWEKALAQRTTFEFEHRVKKASGDYGVFSIRAIPVLDGEGFVKEWVGVHTDITPQKHFTEELSKQVRSATVELNQKNRQLSLMNEELSSFTHIASHDLKEPLRKIRIFADQIMSEQDVEVPEQLKDKLRRILKSVERMQLLIDDLLEFSGVDYSNIKLSDIDFEKLMDQVLSEFNEEILKTGTAVTVSCSASVTAVHFQMLQVFRNLLSNSIKFRRSAEKLVVLINCHPAHNDELPEELKQTGKKFILIQFKDNGIGFEPQYARKIFEMFQRLHGKYEYEGTGVGLAIVKKIILAHGGLITATGTENDGAEFNIFLPDAEAKFR